MWVPRFQRRGSGRSLLITPDPHPHTPADPDLSPACNGADQEVLMLVHRRITLACAIAALAVAPSSALAMPATDPPPRRRSSRVAPIVREVQTGGDTTLALVLSGSALLIAAGAAALSGHDHRRIGKVV